MAVVCAFGVVGIPARADDNPGYDRPGLGFTPAVLRTGNITWEQGLPDWSRAGGAALCSADTLLRLGVGGPFELQLGTSYNHLSTPATTAWGRGDSSIGLKFALPASGELSWGLLGNVTFTDGARALRGDARQYLLGAVFNWQIDPRNTLGAYLETVRSGGRNDHLVALHAGRALGDSVGVYAEAAWRHSATDGSGSTAGAGLAWQATPRVQLDASFRRRLGGATDDWQAGLGLSVYFGRL